MSGQQPLPWMKLWVNDFIGRTVAWNGVTSGLYAQLLILQWAIGSLPDDAAELASILRYDPATFATAWPTVRRAFDSTADGRLVNHDLEVERAQAYGLRTKLSAAGREGAKKRKEKQLDNKPSQALSPPNGRANGQAYTHQHQHQHQDSDSNSEAIREREKGDAGGATHAYRQLSAAEHAQWMEIRHAYKHRLRGRAEPTNSAWGKARDHAAQLVKDNRATWASLRISIVNYADYCVSTGDEPMCMTAFFGSSEEPWSKWQSMALAPEEKNARLRGFQ